MNLWHTRARLALLLLVGGPTMLWAQAPGPGIYLAPPAARPDGVMPPPAQRRVQVLTELSGIARQATETSRKLEKAQEASRIDTLLLTNEFQQIQAKLGRAQALLGGARKQLAAIVGVGEVQMAELAGDLS